MDWPKPQYLKSRVGKAGRTILDNNASFDDFKHAFNIIEHWRSCHGYPVNTFQSTLRSKLKTIDTDAIVAQRLKRMPSILNKLNRFPSMSLDRMQDFGGLRAVVGTLPQLRLLEANYRHSHFKHELVSCKDYVSEPKPSGYRSIHLVYKYKNPQAPEYNGLFVELQLRTKLQHAWATAVETMGTFLDEALKSSEGPDIWLKYFALCGAAFAYYEASPTHATFDGRCKKDIYQEFGTLSEQLRVKDKLKGFSVAAQNIASNNRKGAYHLIVLKFVERRLSIESYSKSSLEAASDRYAELELQITQGAQMHAVLVSAGRIENLRRAYPSYFLDTREFIGYLTRIEKELARL